MKKLLFTVAALASLLLTADRAAAQHPLAGHMPGGCTNCGHGDTRYGWHPIFSKVGLGGGSDCAHGQCSTGLFGGKFHGGLFGHGGGWHGLGGSKLLGGGHGGHGFGGGFGGGRGGQTLPVVDPRSGQAGQLVFPQNPFIRSPRDFFMMD